MRLVCWPRLAQGRGDLRGSDAAPPSRANAAPGRNAARGVLRWREHAAHARADAGDPEPVNQRASQRIERGRDAEPVAGSHAVAECPTDGRAHAGADPFAHAEPTAEPTASASAEPSASAQAIDPTSREVLIQTLLDTRDVPDGLEAGDLEEGDEVDDPAWAANDGIRVVRTVWRGSTDEPIQAIYDYRYQFPDAESAAAFYTDAEDSLAETSVGMAEDRRFETDELGEQSVVFTGEVEGIDGFNYNYLSRVGNVVAKTWLTVPSTQDPDVPLGVAAAATGKVRSVLGIEAPVGKFPNAEEAAIMEFIPEPIRPSCHPAEEIYNEEVDTVRCDGATEHPPIDYSLFETKSAMDDAFVSDVEREETTPTSEGSCAEGNYTSTYTIDGAPAGQILCVLYDAPDGKQYKVIEWTNDNRNILTYMSSATRTWDDLISYWTDEAGPINT